MKCYRHEIGNFNFVNFTFEQGLAPRLSSSFGRLVWVPFLGASFRCLIKSNSGVIHIKSPHTILNGLLSERFECPMQRRAFDAKRPKRFRLVTD